VALDNVPRGRLSRGRAFDQDPVSAIAGDDIAGTYHRPADQVVLGAKDVDAVVDVSDCGCPGGVRSDEVPLDDVVRRGLFGDVDPPLRIPRDDVARTGRRPSDRVRSASKLD